MFSVGILDPTVIVSKVFGRFILIALGLVIIFGMMGVINLAHGEFMMIGAYTTVILKQSGLPFIGAIIMGGIVTGIVGAVLERLLIRRFYGRVIETLIVTWGVSIILTQLMLVVFGSTYPGISIPFSSVTLLSGSLPVYEVVLMVVAGLLVISVYAYFNYTQFGRHARATMQNTEMAASIGVNTSMVYFRTFVIGSVIAGIAGGLLAPLYSITPYLGQSFIIEAFMIVIVGGSYIFLGLISSSFSLAVVSGLGAYFSGGLMSKVSLLVTSILILRIFPEGLSGYIREWNE